MIGETYFQTRAQLGTALFSLQTLAGECRAPSSTLIALQQLQAGLREPFCFIALGSAKSGKSSLFNALFGRELCRLHGNDDGPRIRVFKYGDEEREVPGDGGIIECFCPAIVLRDFSLVEAAVTDTQASPQSLLETKFVPHADVIFIVLSASDPSAAETWKCVARLDRAKLCRVVIVVQQADLLTSPEIDAIVRQMERAIEERLGQARPVFAVSARNAIEGRHPHRDSGAAGFRQLEKFIDDEVAASPDRRERLGHVGKTALGVLSELDRENAAALARAARDSASLKQLTRDLAERNEESLRQIAGILWTLTQACEATQRQADKELARKMHLARLAGLLVRPRPVWPGEFQRGVEREIREATARQIESSGTVLGAELRADEQHLQAGLEKHFAAELRRALNVPNLQNQSATLVKRIQSALADARSPSDGEPWLLTALASAGAWLWLPVAIVLSFTGFAVYAILEDAVFKEAAVAAAATAGIALLVVALVVQGRVQAGFRQHMIESREHLINVIEDHLRQALDDFYAQFDDALQPLRSHCLSLRKVHEPMRTRIRQLEAVFGNAIEIVPAAALVCAAPLESVATHAAEAG